MEAYAPRFVWTSTGRGGDLERWLAARIWGFRVTPPVMV